MIRVLLVDDHPLVRSGLRALVETADDITVMAEAASGEEAVEAAAESVFDVVLMDVSMPGMGGIAATQRLTTAHPGLRVIVLTSFHDPTSVRQAVEAGAVGYLLKDADPASVVAGIRAAAGGGAPLDPRAARALLPTRNAEAEAVHPARPPTGGVPSGVVSGREAEVLVLLGQGLANKQIARQLGITERTVKAHVGSVFRRIGVADRTSAALWARDNGY